MKRIFQTLRYFRLSGIFIPFRIHHPAGISIRRGAHVALSGRVTIGNPARDAAHISLLPVNIYIGEMASVRFGHSISFGPGVNCIVKNKASLSIGNSTYFTSDLHLEAVHEISIGDDCAISWGTTIIDSDHHTLVQQDKTVTGDQPVSIGNHVWIGCNVTILKGTQIGDHCVVAAGSVVKGIFPAHSLIAGNPAKMVRSGVNWN